MHSKGTRGAQAVIYFQRALNLNPNCLEAWTLIGHEYLEMKNPNAAIEAYRRAVDVNAKDFRAWYGLGQTYEMLVMPYYALFYYRKAAQLRPNDARMWVRALLQHTVQSERDHSTRLRNKDRENKQPIQNTW